MSIDMTLVREPAKAGRSMHTLMAELFPICRSITGEGLRQTLRRMGEMVPVDLVETPSGSKVFDWVVPPEWTIRAAWIEAPDGRRVVDLADSSLHVLNYSAPVDAVVTLDELREHVFVHDNADLVPYRTSYYEERWGFCTSRRVLEALEPGSYRVVVDSTLAAGSTAYAEAIFKGETDDVVLLTTYACHPSLANDNLSGVVLLAEIAKLLVVQPALRYTYRLVWGPGTLGPLCWLSANGDLVSRVRHGLAVSCVGDPGPLTYKRSRRGADVDRIVEHVLRRRSPQAAIEDWSPYGGDERQFCSPGFDLPFGALSRTPAGRYPECHSSADNLDFVRPQHLQDSYDALVDVLDVLESDATLVNLAPYGEPQLGRRGLYRGLGGGSSEEMALLWVLSLADGSVSLLDIAERSALPWHAIRDAADRLAEHGLVGPATT